MRRPLRNRLARAWREIVGDAGGGTGGEPTWKGAALNRLTQEWIASAVHPDQEARWGARRLRGRARELARNEGFPRQFLNLLTANVIGPTGPKLQAQVRRGESLDRRTNARIEEAWRRWGQRPITVDRRLTWPAFQRLALRTVAIDGEVFIRKFRDFPNGWGFALQLIDADQVDEQLNRERSRSGNEIRLGVEIDPLGAPVAYWVGQYRPTLSSSSLAIERERERNPADEMIHHYVSDRANQTRGITWFHAVMSKIKMLGGYTEAELVAARAAAAKMGFFQSRAGEVTAGESETNKAIEMDANPGTLEQLPPGWEFKEWSPDHPVAAFPDFVKAMLHEIASGLGVSYTALSGDLEGVNYSSIRAGDPTCETPSRP